MTEDPAEIPRLAPNRPLPAYRYVPGRAPHPSRDPRGHSHGEDAEVPPAPDPARWWKSEEYLFGFDLFNRGYYWEAHEAWEGLWHACGREGKTADFLKALIALAAAGLKAREGIPAGVEAHTRRAAALLQAVDGGEDGFMGLDIGELEASIRTVAGTRPVSRAGGTVVFPFTLVPARPTD